MRRFIKLALAGAVGAYVAEAYVLPALNIPSASGPGMDDVVVGVTVAATCVIVDRLF
jgi:hypothetical protein